MWVVSYYHFFFTIKSFFIKKAFTLVVLGKIEYLSAIVVQIQKPFTKTK